MKEWKPISRPQEQFLSLPDTIREGFFGGAAGPGKSECLMMYPIVRGYYRHPRFKALFMRRTYDELKREIIPRSKDLYSAFGGKFNKTDLAYRFDEGGMIFFGHCEHEDDVHKYDSMEINLFLPDELESFTEWQYLYIGFTRVRSSVADLPAIIRAAGMPGGIGHTWVKKRFIDPCVTGSKVIIGRGGNKRIFIHSTLADNPLIDKSYSNALDALPDAERKAKKFGDWNSYKGQVFDELRVHHHPDEPDNALHVIEPFDIPDWWPKVVAIDWGYAAMTWVGYGAISPLKRLYLYREQSWTKTKIEGWAPYVKELIQTEHPAVVRLCKSAAQNRGQEHTIQSQIETAIDHPVELAAAGSGARIAGKILIHEYLRFRGKYIPKHEREIFDESKAMYIFRNLGQVAYNDYLARFDEMPPEDNLPKLQIFNTCPLVIEALRACSYAKSREGVESEDVAEFPGDDPYDGLRYLVDTAERFFDQSKAEFAKITKHQDLVTRLQQTGDMTNYYIHARRLDSERNGDAPVRRYHR